MNQEIYYSQNEDPIFGGYQDNENEETANFPGLIGESMQQSEKSSDSVMISSIKKRGAPVLNMSKKIRRNHQRVSELVEKLQKCTDKVENLRMRRKIAAYKSRIRHMQAQDAKP